MKVAEAQRLRGRQSLPAQDVALRAISSSLGIFAVFEQVLEKSVFSREVAVDRKDRLRFCRLLISPRAYWVLAIIWKESEFVHDETLKTAGLVRSYEGVLTAHRLAVDLARSPYEVARLNSEVRAICLAAAAFGLVERSVSSQTRVEIRGTQFLNQVMNQIGLEQMNIMTGSSASGGALALNHLRLVVAR